jgi:hypothetical protein
MAVADSGGDNGGTGGGTTVRGPETFGIAGTRGNESRSLSSNGDAAGDVPFSPSGKYGVKPGIVGALPGDCGSMATSTPPGGDVGGDDEGDAMTGNENSSFPGGRVGAIPNGEIFVPARKSGGDPAGGGIGAVPGVPGTSAVTPASDAAMARRSVSVNGPGEDEGRDPGMAGADSTVSVPRSGSISSVSMVVGIVSDSASVGNRGVAP